MNNLINFQSSLTPLSGCQAKILSSVVPEHEVTSPIGSWDTVICVWRCILENIKSKRESQTSFQRFFTQTFLNWKRFEAMAWYLATLIISVLWRVLESFMRQSCQVRNQFNFGPREWSRAFPDIALKNAKSQISETNTSLDLIFGQQTGNYSVFTLCEMRNDCIWNAYLARVGVAYANFHPLCI